MGALSEAKTVLSPEDLQMQCNQECSCDFAVFDPICDETKNVMYYSPCTAGCLNKNETTYFDCQCMGHPNDRNVGTKGKCGVSCSFMPGFLVLMFISTWFTFMAAMPGTVATLRAVEPMHKSLALGIESIILRLTGTIPGPVLFGYLIDKTCLLNGKLGNCLMYNNDDMAVNLTIVFVVFKILAVAFFALALFFSHRSHIPEEPADLQENDATNN